MTGFSQTAEAGGAVSPCDPSIIPIFPLRYALSLETLKTLMTPVTQVRVHPTSIRQHNGYSLLRVRQGYVFIFAESHRGEGSEPRQLWQAFRYQTDAEDDNSSVPRGDTQLQSNHSGGGYRFIKYTWADGTAVGDWVIRANEASYPYAFVSNQTTTVWIAYSEYRWPAHFFDKAERDVAFREKLMTKVDVAAKSGTHAAPLGELADLSPAFFKPGGTQARLNVEEENALRHTAVEIENMDHIARCPNSRENGVLVGLKDPVGEHLDIGKLIGLHGEVRQTYLAEHQYPLTIGRAIDGLIKSEQFSPDSFLPDWLRTVPLSSGYTSHFAEVEAVVKELDEGERRLVGWFRGFQVREDEGTLGHLLGLTMAEIEATSGRTKVDVLTFYTLVLQRVHMLITSSPVGSGHVLGLMSGQHEDSANVQKVVEEVQKWLAATAQVVADGVGGSHKGFVPALEASFTVFGKEIAQAAAAPGATGGTVTLTTNMFTRNLSTVTSVQEISSEFQRMLDAEGFGSVHGQTMTMGGSDWVRSGTIDISAPEASRVGLVTFHARLDVAASGATIDRYNTQAQYERLGKGIGTLAAFLSLYTTMADMDAGSNSVSDVGKALDAPSTKLIAGFADAYSSVVGVYEARTFTQARASSEALRHVFGQNARLVNAVRVPVAGAGRAVVFLRVSAKIAGVVGIVVSAGMAWEGWKRGDKAMWVGNSIMAGAALALISATGVGALIVAAILVIGFIISLASMSEIDLWVHTSFYGSSDKYWGVDRDQLPRLTQRARALAYTTHADYRLVKGFFDDELARFIDVTSQLSIQNAARGDNAFEVHCGVLQTQSDADRMSVAITYERGIFVNRSAAAIRKVLIAPGVVRVITTPPEGRFGNLDVEVSINRVNGGKFTESETYSIEAL